MPNSHSTLSSLFTDIADAIRTKKGEASTVKYVADSFPTAIANIPTSGGGTSLSGVSAASRNWIELNFMGSSALFSATFSAVSGALYYVVVCEIIIKTTLNAVSHNDGYGFALLDNQGNIVGAQTIFGSVTRLTASLSNGTVLVSGIASKNSLASNEYALLNIYALT